MTAAEEPTFHLVRQGYDIDQVNTFLRTQASAWAAAVESADGRGTAAESETTRVRRAAQTRIDELEAHISHLTQESSRQVVGLQKQVAELQSVQDEIDQVHQQQEALSAALQTATETREQLIDAANVDIAERYEKAQAATQALGQQAAAEAEQIVSDARNRAIKMVRRAQGEIEARGRENEAAIRARRVEAEDQLAARLALSKKEADELQRQVGQLTSQRDQLVNSLEAIATAGLQAHYGVAPPTAETGEDELIDLSDSVTIAGG